MRKYKLLSLFVLTIIFLFSFVLTNCDILGDDIETIRERARNSSHVPVKDITGVPTLVTAGVPLTLSGNVEPKKATNKDIIFSVHEAGSTGAVITEGNVLTAPNAGTVTVRAEIANGRTAKTPFIKDFSVTVSARSEITVSQTVFTPVYVGYSQRDAQTVTISNIGTKAANVFGIALGGTNAASFRLIGSIGSQNIAAGGSAIIQVQPAENLGVGTYNATITVTYDEGRTAFNTVSFAVNPVSITSVVITGVAAPVRGAVPSAESSGVGIFTRSNVTWSPNHNPFQGGTIYTASITLTANSGYTFTGLATATINGSPANIIANTGAAVMLMREFPETEHVPATVIFNVNHSDTAGATPPSFVSATTAAGKLTELPTAPTRSEGWGAGMTFVEWNTQTDSSGIKVDTNTTFTEDTTVYAKWLYTSGSPAVDGETLVIVAPAYETNQGEDPLQGTWHPNNKINSDGSVFFSGDAERYSGGSIRFMWDVLDVDDYDFVVLSFVGERPSGTTTWMSFINKTGRGSGDFISTPVTGTGSYNLILAASGSVRFAIKNARDNGYYGGVVVDGYKSGIALQRNGNGSPPSGIGGTIKFTRAVFSKGTRYNITFDIGYPEGETINAIQAVSGVAIGPLPVPAEREGYKFVGWRRMDNSAGVTDATSMPAQNIDLEAVWFKSKPTEPITVDFNNTTFSAIGNATWTVIDGGAGYEYSTTNYNQHAKFEVTLPEGFVLADYDKISFTLTAISGDTNYKSCNVPGGKPITAWSAPHVNNATNVTTYAGTAQNVLSFFPLDLTFDIAKTKELNATTLTGTFELGVAINCNAASYRITNFRIYQDE